jgi:hypothetical protein
MASETMVLEITTSQPQARSLEGSSLEKLLPETIPSATGNPVDVIIGMRKDMAEFLKAGGDKQAFRETLREELKKACMEALQRSAAAAAAADASDGVSRDGPAGYPNIEPIVEYLTERGVIRPKLSRAQVRRLAKSVLKESSEKTSKKESLVSSKKESGS